jgi:hypothetical protein
VGLRRAIRKFGIERFKKNCILATEGFDWVIRKMFGPVPGSHGGAGAGGKKPDSPQRLGPAAPVRAYSTKLEQ